jgi:DNA-binding GntR family transcriptional regulator
MRSSPLARQIARDISNKILSKELREGEHLTAQSIADSFGVSRSPVREALQTLCEAGVVEQKPKRGFFVTGRGFDEDKPQPLSHLQDEQQSNYLKVADDWRTDSLPEEVTEQYLRDRYALTKAQLQDILVRAVREGWAERKPGYGWRFLSVAKTPEAFEQIYQFRMVIEPAAMLSPGYAVDMKVVNRLRAVQQQMLDHDIEHLPVDVLVRRGAGFHEELISFSNNPNFHTALTRVNQMRRLLEYRSAFNPERFIQQCTEHLEILDLLARGEVLEASFVMKKHLGGAIRSKQNLMRSQDHAV